MKSGIWALMFAVLWVVSLGLILKYGHQAKNLVGVSSHAFNSGVRQLQNP